MNVEELREALGPELPFRTLTPSAAIIRRAARLILDGEKVWWCEQHRSGGNNRYCIASDVAAMGLNGDCRMVERLLIPITDGEGK